MDALTGTLVVLAPVVVTLVVGALVRARSGRVRTPHRGDEVLAASVAAEHGELGDRATLLQFSTEFCGSCRGTRSALERLASERPGVRAIDVDLTHRPDLAARLSILQTPTVVLLDGRGRGRARIGGPPRIADLTAELDSLLGGARVVAS